jgi:hypothetical protein
MYMNIAVFIHKDNRMEVAQGRFSDKEEEGDLTRLESGMSFMQVRASMSMKEKLRQVRGAICVNRREIARTRLEAIAGADNPYSLITIFRRGHLAIKAGGAVYVTRCSPVEVVPRSHRNCTEEIPVTINGTDAFVDPISYVIKSAGSPIHCNDVAPPRYKVGGKWYCSYPELKECHDPAMLPVDEVRIDPVEVNNIGLGKSIYTREQLEEFARFQDSQGTQKAYLAEMAEMAYTDCNEKGEWGLALSSAAQGSLIDILGASFFPLYRVVGPMIFFLSLVLLVWGGVAANGHGLSESDSNNKMQGVWDLGADGLVGDPVSAGDFALQLDGCSNGRNRSASWADDGDRSCPGAGGGEDEEKEHEPRGPQEEVLVVAKRKRKGGAAQPPHRRGSRRRRQCYPESSKEHYCKL